MNDQRHHLMMEAEILFIDPDLDFAPAVAARSASRSRCSTPTGARIMIRVVTPLSEDAFRAWVESIPALIEHDGDLMSWGRANRVN
jgi:hypothetical protein